MLLEETRILTIDIEKTNTKANIFCIHMRKAMNTWNTRYWSINAKIEEKVKQGANTIDLIDSVCTLLISLSHTWKEHPDKPGSQQAIKVKRQ